jgi:acetoin utilization deacetylase AcuC-like enzyme
MTEQRKRRARIVKKAIESIEEKLGTEAMKPTLADLVRLLQIEKELVADEPREIRVRWIDAAATTEPLKKA